MFTPSPGTRSQSTVSHFLLTGSFWPVEVLTNVFTSGALRVASSYTATRELEESSKSAGTVEVTRWE